MKRIVVAAKAGTEQPWLADAAADLAEEIGADVAVVSFDGLELEALSTVPRSELAKGAEAAAKAMAERIASRGITVVGHHRSGPVVRGILVFAEEQEADLIVVGATTPRSRRPPHARQRHDPPDRALAAPRARDHPAPHPLGGPTWPLPRLSGAGPSRRSRRTCSCAETEEKGASLKRVVGLGDLTALGLGAIIGTGIFVVIGEAIASSGPSIVLAFVLAGVTCAFSALCYAELASSIPVAGSAYTYAYATMGELIAWIIGWDLILEYGVSVAAVAVGWGEYLNIFLDTVFGISLPESIAGPPGEGGMINLPAVFIVLAIMRCSSTAYARPRAPTA